jgi:hypothetical protein
MNDVLVISNDKLSQVIPILLDLFYFISQFHLIARIFNDFLYYSFIEELFAIFFHLARIHLWRDELVLTIKILIVYLK